MSARINITTSHSSFCLGPRVIPWTTVWQPTGLTEHCVTAAFRRRGPPSKNLVWLEHSAKQQISCCHARCSCNAPDLPEDLKCLEETVGSQIRPDVCAQPNRHGCIPASSHTNYPPCFPSLLTCGPSEAWTYSSPPFHHCITQKWWISAFDVTVFTPHFGIWPTN